MKASKQKHKEVKSASNKPTSSQINTKTSEISDEKILQINKRSFITVCCILSGILAIAYALTFILPKGTFINEVYVLSESQEPLSFLSFIISPLETLWNSSTSTMVIMVSLFMMILSGVFNIIDKTGGIKSIMAFIIIKNEKHKMRLVYEMILIFMLFGSLFGIFEEAVALLPIVVILAISMGWDTFTGICICLLATGFGFSTALTNPFSVGLSVQTINETVSGSNLSVTDGIWFRAIIFLVMYAVLCVFVTMHIKKIEKNPRSSPTYEQDNRKREHLHITDTAYDKKTVVCYGIMFITVVTVTIAVGLIPATSGLTVPAIALSFLVGSFACTLALKHNFKYVLKEFCSGVVTMLPAIVMVLLAASIKLVLDKGMIMDTIINEMLQMLENNSLPATLLLIYAAILIIQFFISSASAKVVVIIPIIAMLADKLGLSQNLALLSFVFGDGYTDLIYPTNAILMISLGMVSFSYGKWLKKTLPLQLFVLALTVGFLFLGLAAGY